MMETRRSFNTWVALKGLCARFKSDRKGGVLMIMGFAIVPMTFAVGFGIDYSRAMRLQTHLNAAADAAALAAVAPAMVLQPDAASVAAAQGMFDAQATMLSGYQNLVRTVTISDSTTGSSGSLGYLRQATVTYTVQSQNIFGGLFHVATLPVRGTSSASAQQPPNVDFYLAMDNSPSMLIPATSAGISQVQAVTGCAFACHEQMPHNDGINVKNSSGLQVLLSSSYYTSGSANYNTYYLYNSGTGVLSNSSGNAMNTTSSSTGNTTTTTGGSYFNPSTITTTTTTVTTTSYTITDSNSGPVTITKTVSSTPTTTTTTKPLFGSSSSTTSTGNSNTSSSAYDYGYWADGYWLTHNYGLVYGNPSSITLRKDDVVSAASQLMPFASNQASQYHVTYQAQMFTFDWTKPGASSPVKTLNALANVSTYGDGSSVPAAFPADDYWWQNSMPSSSTNNNDQATEMTNMLTTMNGIIPTAGSGAQGATPQKILFLVTDGMIDEGSRYFGPLRSSELSTCTAIKAKGIKIAILYTQYLPETLAGDSWSQSNVAPLLPAPPAPYSAGNAGSSDKIVAALQQCASPGTNGSPLVQTVTANASIITALQQLFSTALQSSRLVQ